MPRFDVRRKADFPFRFSSDTDLEISDDLPGRALIYTDKENLLGIVKGVKVSDMTSGGYGSDHYPVSCDVRLRCRQGN